MFTLMSLIQHGFGSPSHGKSRRKEIGIHVGKKAKTVIVADDAYNTKKKILSAIRNILELINLN